MTDAEVVTFLRRYPRISCGRFRESQLERALMAPAYPVAGWRRWLGATVAVLGLGGLSGPKVQAQSSPPMYWGGPQPKNMAPPVYTTPSNATRDSVSQKRPETTALTAHPFMISGVVYNANGSPVSGVSVDLGGWDVEMSVTTDVDGSFHFVVDRDSLGEYAALSVMRFAPLHLYYQTADVEIDFASNQQYQLHLKSQLKRRRHMMGKFR